MIAPRPEGEGLPKVSTVATKEMQYDNISMRTDGSREWWFENFITNMRLSRNGGYGVYPDLYFTAFSCGFVAAEIVYLNPGTIPTLLTVKWDSYGHQTVILDKHNQRFFKMMDCSISSIVCAFSKPSMPVAFSSTATVTATVNGQHQAISTLTENSLDFKVSQGRGITVIIEQEGLW